MHTMVMRTRLPFVRTCSWLLPALGLCAVGFGWLHSRQPFDFLSGCKPLYTSQGTRLYQLPAHFEELHRKAEQELAKLGFTSDGSTHRSDRRVIEYRRDGKTVESVIFLVEMNRPGQVGVEVLGLKSPSTFAAFTRGVRRWLGWGNGASKDACLANLKQIQSAKTTWALQNRKTDNDVPQDADLFGPPCYIQVTPACPQGGSNILERTDNNPQTSILLHKLP